jgi:hypothetical protein
MTNELHRMPCLCNHALADHAPNTVAYGQPCDLCDCQDFTSDIERIAKEPW